MTRSLELIGNDGMSPTGKANIISALRQFLADLNGKKAFEQIMDTQEMQLVV